MVWNLFRAAMRKISTWASRSMRRISAIAATAFTRVQRFRRVHPWITILIGLTAIGLGLYLLHPVILPWLGFGVAGIAAYTFASGFQSLFLRGNTGGPFSYFQSLGTRLAPPAAIVVVFGAGLIIFGLAFIFAPAGEPDGNAAGPTGTENVDPDSGETTGFTGPSTAEIAVRRTQSALLQYIQGSGYRAKFG